MKKILSLLLAISIIFSCINIGVFAETEGALSISAPTSAVPGETINVIVSIPSSTNAVSGNFNLVYDNTMLSVSSCTAGTILSDKNVVINDTYSASRIRMSFDGDTLLTQGGIILNVAFNVLPGASGTVKFEVEKFKLYDENYEAIEIDETVSDLMHIVNDADTKVTVSCNDTVNTGETLTVSVDISNALNVSGGSFNLVYDSEKFTLSSATAGSVLSAFSRQLNKTYASNKVRLTWAGSSAMTEDGTVLTLVFTAKDGVSGNADFILEKLSVSDINGLKIESVAKSGSTNVVCTHNFMEWTVTEEPSCTETGTESYMCECGHTTKTRNVSATGHLEMEWVITTEATCDNPGIKEYTCKACGYVENISEIAPHGHVYESVITPPSQANQGYTTHTCTGCGHSYTDTYTNATGYTISYDANGGENAPPSQKKAAGESIVLSETIPARAGYVFLGWATDKNAENAGYYAGNTYSEDADLTLYALWDANEYTITYVVDGETVSVQTYDYEELIDALDEPEKEGYTFSGWDEIPITMPDNDITVSGSFTINSYIVTFDANGGENAPEEFTDVYNSSVTIPDAIPTKAGSSFLGWATSSNAKKAEYNAGDSIILTEDINLYAVWVDIWSGSASESFSGGTGTETDPYIIKTSEDLKLIVDKVNSGDATYASACYIMANDIALNDVSNVDNWSTQAPANEWIPIGNVTYPFAGTFDGNGYTISGLYINKTGTTEADNNQGLFGYISEGALIANLGIVDGYISANENVGGIAGYGDGAEIRNCYNLLSVDGMVYVAGIVGRASNIKVIASYNGGAISALPEESTWTHAGGICGNCLDSVIDCCYNYGEIRSTGRDDGAICGGIGGASIISQCYNIGTIKGGNCASGIVAVVTTGSVVENCLNAGRVETWFRSAGIVPWMEGGTVINCINIGTIITGENAPVGAITTNSKGTVTDCYYLDTCGASGSGTALTYAQLQSAANYAYYATESTNTWQNEWQMGHNPYGVYPMLKGMTNLMEIPIEFDLNGGSFDEYEFCASVVASNSNTIRGIDYLVVYNKSNTKTATDDSGYEVIVDGRNVVVGLKDLDGNNLVPSGGFVLSGHGMMHEWLETNIELGDKVYCDANTLEVKVYKKNPEFTFAYGFNTYLPTPKKDGYVFGGWQDKNGEIITYLTKIHESETLNLRATWTKPEIAAEAAYGNSRYMMFDVGTSYESAKKYCESLGGHLATITSKEEDDVVIGLASSGKMRGYIIGASDISKEGTFEWDTGESFTYTNWNTGEPNNSDGIEDAVEIKTVWNDISETNVYDRGFICEIDNFVPVGATIYDGHYYELFDSNVSWEYAKAYCESKGGHLVSITNDDESNAIAELLSQYSSTNAFYWLGATDLDSEGIWKWVTGEEWSYSNWNQGQPDNAGGKEHYLHIYTESGRFGKWNDLPNVYPSKGVGFICEFDEVKPVATTEYNGHKYLRFDNRVSWTNAREYCESIGGHLATVSDQSENDVIAELATTSSDTNVYNHYWLGATDVESEGDWKWITGEEWSYTNWKSGQPDNTDGNEHYLHMYNDTKRNGTWNDIPVNFIKTAFICEISDFNTTLTYDANGGENAPVALVCKADADITLSSETPTRAGYIFKGWAETKTGAVKYHPSQTIRISQNTTLYAVWEEKKFTITYVTAKSDEFGEWGEWQDESITNSATVDVEKRYRYRNVDTTTSDKKTLSGWILRYTSSQTGSWSAWSKSKVDSYNTDSIKREVMSRYVQPVYATEYRYGTWTNGINISPCPQCGANKYGGTWTIKYTDWSTSMQSVNTSGLTYCGYENHTHFYPYSNNDNRANWYSYNIDNEKYYWQESTRVLATEGYYEYRYRDIKYTYHFVKYGEWSEWQSEKVLETSNRDVDIQYRQRSIPKELSFVEENAKDGNITETRPSGGNYYCIGWSTEADSTKAEYLAGDTINLNKDIILYAVWKEGGEVNDTIEWQVDENTLVILGEGEIPDYSQGNAPWYEYKDKITRIVIGNNITSIGDYAFYNLTALETVSVPETLKNIGEYAFSNCVALENIDLSRVEKIESYAFRYCSALTDVVIYANVSYDTNIYANCSGIDSVVVDESVTEIKAGILNNCGTISSLSIPDSVISIAENAFTDCVFTSVIYPGTKDDFAKLLTHEKVIDFERVTCVMDGKTYLYTDFFAINLNITDIAFEKKSVGMYVGEYSQIIAVVIPDNANEKLVWSSDDETVATVDNAGNVTAIREGVANISAKSESGAVQSSCVVYVTAVSDESSPVIYCESIDEIQNSDTFDVNISLRNNPGVASMRLSVSYDKTSMTLINVIDSGLIGGAGHSNDYEEDTYTLYWDNGTSTSNFTGDGDIVKLTFKVKDNTKSGEYPIILSYNSRDIINCDLVPVEFDVINGFVTVKAFTYGDVNSDQSVDVIDSAYLSRYIAKWTGVTINPDAADVNKDKRVNALDSAILKRHLAKWVDYTVLPKISPVTLFATTMDNTEPAIGISDKTALPGKTVDVAISLKDNPGIVTMRLDVEYDHSVMELVNVTDLGIIPGALHSDDLTVSPYCLYWDNGESESDYSKNGNLVKLTFRIKEDAKDGTYPITVSYDYGNHDIFNAALEEIVFKTDSGSVTVTNITEPKIVISGISVGESIAFNAELLSHDAISGRIVIATYSADSRLCDIKFYDAKRDLDISIEKKNATTAKVMWWDGVGALKPIADAVSFNLE